MDVSLCIHCQLPVPRGSTDPRFCCIGCRTVHELLTADGLERFYALGGGKGQPIGVEPNPAEHAWMTELVAAAPPGDQVRIEFDVQGIHCAACVWLLAELWNRQPGAQRIDINPALGVARLTFRRDELDLATYVQTIERLGYRVAPLRKQTRHDDRGLLIRLGVCAALAMNAMMFAFAGYFGLSDDSPTVYSMFHWLAFGFATIAVLVGGPVFFRSAFAGLRRRVLHLDLPISLGILLAYAGSSYQFLLGGGTGYFDTVTIFVALMLVGRYLQQRALRRNRDYLLANTGAELLRARVFAGDAAHHVPITEIRSGDRILLNSGDLVPARSILHDQPAQFSLDWINGESQPVTINEGGAVPAGAFLRSARNVRVTAAEDAADSELLRLLATPGGDRDDRRQSPFWVWLNRTYVWLVLSLATIAGLVWLAIDPSRALDVTVSVLVVTCPCALGLATPLAFDMALAMLRRRGIYVRTTSLLERARRVQKVIFDKTGTLTWGNLTAHVMRPVPADHADVLFTMASSSNHPVSRAIVTAMADEPRRLLADLTVEEVPGRGVHANYGGHEYYLGAQSYVFHESPSDREGRHCLFTRDGHVETCFRIEEHLRPGFPAELQRLRDAGQDVFIMSGDEKAKVAGIAGRLGVPPDHAFGELSPDDKARLVTEIDAEDTLMIGDGLNDALAFDSAWCAGAAGLERSSMPARADFFFLGEGSAAVRSILGAARQLHMVVISNLWLAAAYNGLALAFCFAGMMTPLLCAILMPASSLLLVWNTAARLRTEQRETSTS